MTDFLVGTGGWAYFQIPDKSSLKAYSELFNFVEVNSTFYEYPSLRTVEHWRRAVPAEFTFSVRCHQDLTHRIGLKPTSKAFECIYKMKAFCEILQTPFLVLETPASLSLENAEIQAARDFFYSISLGNLQLIWEYRAPFTREVSNLMQDFGIVQSVDLSLQKPALSPGITYSRLFGKGKHNRYQFTDDEIAEIEQKGQETGARTVILAFHGLRMNSDALRTQQHLLTGKFLATTDAVGVDSASAILAEDTVFPVSRAQLIEKQGWKVFDLTADKRIHLAEVLSKIPEKKYSSVSEVVDELKIIL